MNAHELRTGNYVLRRKFNPYSKGFNETRCTANDIGACGISTEKFNPIPIDGEWLLDLGFTYYSENKSYQLDSDTGFSIWGKGSFVNMANCCDSEFGRTINFVHDLQNVWFSLTGKELKRVSINED